MKRIYKTSSLCLLLAFFLGSCELIELTQEDAIKATAHGSSQYIQINVRNISERDLHNVTWSASISDDEEETIGSVSGGFGYISQGDQASERVNYHCYGAACAHITIRWKNAKGRTCYEWCTIYL